LCTACRRLRINHQNQTWNIARLAFRAATDDNPGSDLSAANTNSRVPPTLLSLAAAVGIHVVSLMMKILAISGSLRAASINTALLRAAQALTPVGMTINLYTELGDLPLFNPDLESVIPATVRRLRLQVAEADALLIASPEYAHGVSGAIKNGLDWLVSDETFANKPVAVLNASPRARHADAALRETLITMAAQIVEPASVTIPLLGAGLDERRMCESPDVSDAIRMMLARLKEDRILRRIASDTSF
jgi:chromate reductase